MEIKPVGDVLSRAGLNAPVLKALIPNEDNYKVLLMQPLGNIEGNAEGVRNRNRDLARRQFGEFLKDACQTQADLVVTPEYSLPWENLVESIRADEIPADGKLWVLGCESIKLSELEQLTQDLAPTATVLYEALEPDDDRFADPLAYVFRAEPTDGNGGARTVVLVQFKTCPMGDKDHFEINGMQRGTTVYEFGIVGRTLRLVSLICSDALAFEDAHAKAVYDRTLVIHIQLNPKPRQSQFRQYRDRLLRYDGDTTELICLNWAQGVQQWTGNLAKPWDNIAGSAWYLRPNDFDLRDPTLLPNHRRGLYYTWFESLRAHALFFNYQPASYLLSATKVAHIAVTASISRRRGPQLTRTCVWNDVDGAWVNQVEAEDGFSAVVGASGNAKDAITEVTKRNPFEAERVLALSAGKIVHGIDWHDVRKLDSCNIDVSEVIQRVTFCHDTDPQAQSFRVARLKRIGYLWDIIKTGGALPPALLDLKDGFSFRWFQNSPHQNLVSANGQRATVIYLGEEVDRLQVEAVAKRASEFLQRTFSDSDESHDARQRLAVWYRDNGAIVLYDRHPLVTYDNTGNTSEVDIGRET